MTNATTISGETFARGQRVKGYATSIPPTTLGVPFGTIIEAADGKVVVAWDHGPATTHSVADELKRI